MNAFDLDEKREFSCPLTLNSVSELTAIMPRGVRVAFLGFSQGFKDELSVFYRVASPLDAFFDHATQPNGLKFSDKKQLFDTLMRRDINKIVENLVLPEDTKMIVAECGLLSALGKALGQKHKSAVVLCAGIPTAYDLLVQNTLHLIPLKKPAAILSRPPQRTPKSPPPPPITHCDTCDSSGGEEKCCSKENPPPTFCGISDGKNGGESGRHSELVEDFAFVFCCYFALFDWDICALLSGGVVDSAVSTRASAVAGALLKAAKQHSKHSNTLKYIAKNAKIAMSSLVDASCGSLLVSGATQTAAALLLLFRHEDRPPIELYSAAFLLAPQVAKAYAAYLSLDIPFCPPPDPTKIAEALTEYMGIAHSSATAKSKEVLNEQTDKAHPPTHLAKISKALDECTAKTNSPAFARLNCAASKLADYRLRVYRDQLLLRINSVLNTLEQAYPAFFKLHDDDGFCLKGVISSLDSSLALGLAADCLSGNTLLTHMRNKGVLSHLIL